MFYPEGMMHRKINFWVAILVITIIAVSFAYFISAKAGSFNVGGRITDVVYCFLDTPKPPAVPIFCELSCPRCNALLGTACAAYKEIDFVPFGGSSDFICVPKAASITSGTPRPGGYLLGTGVSPSILYRYRFSR